MLKTLLWQLEGFTKSNKAFYAFEQSDGVLQIVQQSNGALYVRIIEIQS